MHITYLKNILLLKMLTINHNTVSPETSVSHKLCNSNIKGHWLLQFTVTNITMKIFEILWKLPKCDTDTKWVNTDGKMLPVDLLKECCHNHQFVKNTVYVKCNKAKSNKTRYTFNNITDKIESIKSQLDGVFEIN